MPKDDNPNFSQIVCGSPQVRAAFLSHPPTQCWWRLILLLHGKPMQSAPSSEEKIKIVANGFRFYAWLYRSLSVIFGLLPLAFIALNRIENGIVSSYWTTASLLAAIYLWCVSDVGFAGAKLYAQGKPESVNYLVAFMVMIIAFLSVALTAISLIAHHLDWIGTAPNVVGASVLFAFGIGSYMIEIIYLVTERPNERGNPTTP